jgi:hypothetical protein
MTRMQAKKRLETPQMNLPFCDNKPMVLPEDKQRELTRALADLLMNAVVEVCALESEEKA